MKKKLLLSLTALTLLASCASEKPVDTSSESESTESSQTSSESKENYDKPEAGEEAIIYQKRAIPTIKRGDSIKLDEYYGVVLAKGQTGEAKFQAYVVKGENDSYIGYLPDGDGVGTDLLFVAPGKLVVNLYAYGVYKTVQFKVEESNEGKALIEQIGKIQNNYTAIQRSYDDEGNEQEIQKVYRSNNYIYSETQKKGYLLSKKDDNIYSFTLDSATDDEEKLDVDMSPQGDKADYNGTFCSFDILANSSYWQYSTMLAANPKYKKFKYAFIASSTMTKRIFKSLFYMSSSYSGYYPYLIFASYQNNELCLLPILLNSSGSSVVSFNEFKITDVGVTKVTALDSYVDQYKAPTPADVSEITGAITYLGTLTNYTLDPQVYFLDSEGNRVSERSPYMNIFSGTASVGGSSGTLPDLTRYAGLKKVTKNAYFGEKFGGTSSTGFTRGGLWSTNNTTYNYYETATDSGTYAVTKETFESTSSTGSSKSYPNWWSYSFMNRQLVSLAISTSLVVNAYPTYNETSGVYTFTGITSSSQALIKAIISSCYHNDSAVSSTNALMSYLIPNFAEMTWKVNYKEDKETISGMDVVLKVKLPKESFAAFDQDYYWVLDCKYYDVGATSLDTIISQLTVPVE